MGRPGRPALRMGDPHRRHRRNTPRLVPRHEGVPPPHHPGIAENQLPDPGDMGRPSFPGQGHARRLPAHSADRVVHTPAAGLRQLARSAGAAPQGVSDLPDRRRADARQRISGHAPRNFGRTRDTAQPAASGHLPDDQAAVGLRRLHPRDWWPACSFRPTTCCARATGSRWPNTVPTAT